MSVVKACCRLEEAQVHESHKTSLHWHPHAYEMESQLIRNDCAGMQWHVAVQREKNTRRQQQTLVLLA
eukprot:227265-Amphidinium_carterae.1